MARVNYIQKYLNACKKAEKCGRKEKIQQKCFEQFPARIKVRNEKKKKFRNSLLRVEVASSFFLRSFYAYTIVYKLNRTCNCHQHFLSYSLSLFHMGQLK